MIKLVGTTIQITNCFNVGGHYGNITPGSEHKIIKPPAKHSNSWKDGVWVKGDGAAVKVLAHEFELPE